MPVESTDTPSISLSMSMMNAEEPFVPFCPSATTGIVSRSMRPTTFASSWFVLAMVADVFLQMMNCTLE